MPNRVFISSPNPSGPRTVTDRRLAPSAAGALPGEFVVFSHWPTLKRDSVGPLVLLADRSIVGLDTPILAGVSLAPSHLNVPYEADETAYGYLPSPGETYWARFEAGTYSLGQRLGLSGSGRLTAYTPAYRLVAMFDEHQVTLIAGAFGRIVFPA